MGFRCLGRVGCRARRVMLCFVEALGFSDAGIHGFEVFETSIQ